MRTLTLSLVAVVGLLAPAIAKPPGHPGPTPPTHPGGASPPHHADAQRTITVGGVERHYLLHVPRSAPGKSTPRPLVFVLHGYGSHAQGMVGITGFDAKADAEGFLVAYPQATAGKDGTPSWNSGINPEFGNTADDVGFVRAVARQLVHAGQVDAKRVYATGLSNGAAMSHRLGIDAADVLAAVAPVAGAVGTRQKDGTWVKFPAPRQPLPILMIHGKQDPNVRYDGGQGAIPPDLFVLPFTDSVKLWTNGDRCTGQPHPQTSVDGNVTTTDYTSCAGASEVVTITLEDGKHEWPIRPGRAGFSATDAVWDFFSRHTK